MKEMKLIAMPLCEEKQEYQTPTIELLRWGIDVGCDVNMSMENDDPDLSGWGDDW